MLFLSEIIIKDISLIKNLSFSFKLPLFIRNDFLWIGETPIFFKYELYFDTNNPVDEFFVLQSLEKSSVYFREILNQHYVKEIIYKYPIFDVNTFIEKLSCLSKINIPYYIKISAYLNDFEKIIMSEFFHTDNDFYFDYINHIFSDYNFEANFKINYVNSYTISTNKRKNNDDETFDIDSELISPTKKILLNNKD